MGDERYGFTQKKNNFELKSQYFVCIAVIDSWGKIPSGVLDGNLFEFGAFSQCLNIDRYDEAYKTKYCLAHLIIDFNGISLSKSYQSKSNHVIWPNNLHAIIEPMKFTPRIALPS